MEKQHISINKLDDYFALARNMKPIEGIQELENQIMNAQMGADKSRFHNLKFKIIMSTSIIVIAAFITSLFYHGNKTAISNVKPVKSIEKQVQTVPADIVQDKKNLTNYISQQNSKKHLEHINTLESSKMTVPENELFNYHYNPSLPTPFDENQIHPNASASGYGNSPSVDSKITRNIKPVDLNIQQLEKLGFSFMGAAVKYQSAVKKLGDLSYVVQSNGEDLEIGNLTLFLKHRDYYPVFITDINCKDLENIDSVLNATKLVKSGSTYTNYARQFQLLPVLIKRPNHAKSDAYKDLIFWFKVTPSLISEINGGEFINRSIVTENRAGMSEADWTAKQNELQGEITTTINQFKPLILNKGQMEKLGFIFGTDSLQYKCTITGHGTINYYTTTGGGYGLKSTAPLVFNGKGPDIYPEFISDINGFQDLKYSMKGLDNKDKWTDKYFLTEIRTLVPVILKQSEYGFPKGKDMLFWFKVTPDFLAALPDTISKDMSTEYNALKESGDNNAGKTVSTTCKYFDVCQLPLEKEYGIKIYPNPANEKFNLEFWPPKNDGTVYTTFELTDLSGKVILKSDMHWFGRTAEIPVSDVKPGIYLIVYKLSTGEVITNKVMITR